MLERSLLTDHSQHAAHSGRILRVFDVQFDIGRKLAAVTVRAQVVGARYFHLAQRGQDGLGALLVVMRLAATRTRDGALIGSRGGESQQFGQSGCAGLMHGRANRHLDGFATAKQLNPLLGVVYRPTTDSELTLSYGSSFRPPIVFVQYPTFLMPCFSKSAVVWSRKRAWRLPRSLPPSQNSNCALILNSRASMIRCGVRQTAKFAFSCITGFEFATL